MKIAIIGGGMAGAALAYVLKNSGANSVVYEAGPIYASGASGNDLGLYNPRFTADRTPQSEYYAAAFALALRTFPKLKDVDWQACGALHLINDDKKVMRFGKTVTSWGWDLNEMRVVSMEEASAIAGVDIAHDALYLKRSGFVSPQKLCKAYLKDVDIHLNVKVEDLAKIEADVKILACGPGAKSFRPDLPINAVRGQITTVEPSALSQDLHCVLCYGGSFTPAYQGRHLCGSTFQRWLDHDEIIEDDDAANIQKLAENIPGLEEGLKVTGHRAAVRATSKDHFPIVGQIDEGLYISAAHGSHGIISTLMAAALIGDMILGRPRSLGVDTIEALSPKRFF